ncbi:3-oxoacyl-[acyl-carrier-protein] reductase FabG-like isoform X2 [Branchiostoma floridae]|uniref:3-oxoacyl-[acyl-carrier-protein] reductase FabG-like isoform X2 n=1 Tax=Branchiostoma floridae TaxID=7739 RepID=A0A9J7KIT8_BRAFL|nr:3-oxoacyl-[acyl-carrier-protein] reductase FabG-like isoform X2 [Branchiostoma floridae]
MTFGASSSIGKGTAVEFAGLGAHLALTGRIQENLQATADACVEAGTPRDKILLVTGDICDEAVQKNLVNQTVEKFGRLDVLANNAGIGYLADLETTVMAEYDKVMNVNLRSVVALTQLCVPHLTRTQGAIVNVSSICGLRSTTYCLVYSMSKAALDQFTRCVALELASKQIRVNSVNPGCVPTEILKHAGLDEEQVTRWHEREKSLHALGRVGEVEEVAKTIAFLASSDASFITGAQVPVDGGRHAMCPR